MDYTNRRKIQILPEGSSKSNEERKEENEKEFESLYLQIGECSLSEESNPPHRRMCAKKTNSVSTSASSSSSHYPEVEEFQKFLEENGGRYGGWKEKDHLFFVKTRSKCNINKCAEKVHQNFPDISIDQVKEHETWYSEYVRLRAANKRAIEEWKRNQKVVPKVEKKQDPEPKPQTIPIKRDENIKEKIEIWKAKCLASKLERLHEHQQEEIRKKKEEEERKKIQEEKRALVNLYKEQKLSFDLALKIEKDAKKLQAKKEESQRTAILLKYFRYEDRRFTERQKALKQQPLKKMPKVNGVKVKRDPNRLLQPTLGWINHIKKTEEKNDSPTYDINHMPKLGKPAWRKGVTA